MPSSFSAAVLPCAQNRVRTKYHVTTNGYAWYDGAVQSQIDFVGDTGSPSRIGRSVFTNDGFGQLTGVNVDVDASDGDGSGTGLRSGTRDRSIVHKLSGDGQVVRRGEVDGIAANGDPHELWYRFNGRDLGYVGNDGTADLNTAYSIAGRQQVSQQGAAGQSETSAGNIAGHALAGAASAIANAVTRSAISGTSFGDNVRRALSDAITSNNHQRRAGLYL